MIAQSENLSEISHLERRLFFVTCLSAGTVVKVRNGSLCKGLHSDPYA